MNTTKKAKEWLICLPIVNLMLVFLLKKCKTLKTHEIVTKDKSQKRTHGYSINLIIKFTVKNKMSL